MRKLTLRSLWSHKRRLVSTVAATVLGVAFISGILVLNDTIGKAFEDLFAEGTEEVSAVVQGDILFSSGFAGDFRDNVDPAVVEIIRGVDGVAAADPYVLLATYSTRVLDQEGDAIGSNQGPPTLVESWVDDDALNPYELSDGSRPPEADDEVAINVAAAEDAGVEVGDQVTIYSTQDGSRQYELVGTFLFGTATSSGGAISVDFTLAEAQRLGGIEDGITNVFVRGDESVTDEALVERINAALPDGAEALTGTAYGQQTADQIKQGFAFFTYLLITFAVIALLVGAFIIYNTFQILVAQRTRELALLRVVGASKGQVLRSVLLEAFVIVLVASIMGILAGIGLASVGIGIFSGGGDLPVSGVSLRPQTLLVALFAGMGVTLVAALMPARRATKVAPLAALRDVAFERTHVSKARLIIGGLVAVLAIMNLVQAWSGDGDVDSLGAVGMGAVLLIIAAIVLGPALAGPTVRVLGGVLPRFRGVTGRMATENAARSPKRTSATASALLIAVALVAFITTVAASATESFTSRIDADVSADVVVMGPFGFGPPTGFSPTFRDTVSAIEGVETVSAMGITPVNVRFPDSSEGGNFLGSVDPTTLPAVAQPLMAQGSISDLTDEGVVVDAELAEDEGLAIGDPLGLTFPGGGQVDLTIQAISNDFVILFPITISDAVYQQYVQEASDLMLFIGATDGANPDAVYNAIDEAARAIPIVDVHDRDAFANATTSSITGFLLFIQIMLLVSVVIALIGIANTLSLSIYERTREIGLVRAIGAARSQVRATFRWEAAIIAVLGTLIGIGIGLICSWAVVTALSGFGLSSFAVPIPALIIWAVVFALLGTLASVLPARRAARLEILQAIATS